MNIKQLKEKIKDLPDNMDVFLAERKTEFGYGLANSAYTKEIFFTDDETPTDEQIADAHRETVLILDEE